ncbi:MAG: tetratricopeptide repeat protein [Calditrichaeota bacterium]|nr:tetratricopeptide repeat protein [Calditrichota bacterium]MCB9087799.1 tetratricopeptide repeat protein [Calditrichia bacterium]
MSFYEGKLTEKTEGTLDNFGLHDKIEIYNREFHVHTGALLENQKIISEVFERGMFLISRDHRIALRSETQQIDYDFLNSETEQFHQSVIEELEALYQIKEKLDRYRHAKSHYYLGILFLRRNLFEEAVHQFTTSIDQDNNFMRAYMGLGISYLKSRQFSTAMATFQKALSMSEKYPDFLNYHGLAHLFLNEYDNAINLFKEAIRLNPNYVEAQFNLGVALYKSALEGVKDPQAVAVPARVSIYLKQVRDLKKYRIPHWRKSFNQLLELLKDNNHEMIIPQLEQFQLRLVDLMGHQEKIYEFYLRFLFGGIDLSLPTINKYERYFIDTNSEHNHYPDYWNDLGTFNLIKSRSLYQKAMEELEKALSLAPEFEDAKHNLKMTKSHEKGFLILLRAILK